jgi:hypothetical protein
LARQIVEAFEKVESSITSHSANLTSNQVLLTIAPEFKLLEFRVESGKKKNQKIEVPVLYGRRGKPEKSFNADAYREDEGFVIEVEAGGAVDNYQFLKDLFQACTMDGVKYLCIAVRQSYRENKNFEQVVKHFEALYASDRLKLPLQGILIVGY